MNYIFKTLCGASPNSTKKKQKREVERVIGITQYGEVICAKGCLPADREKTVKEMFATETDVMTINVSPLRGRTKIIRR